MHDYKGEGRGFGNKKKRKNEDESKVEIRTIKTFLAVGRACVAIL